MNVLNFMDAPFLSGIIWVCVFGVVFLFYLAFFTETPVSNDFLVLDSLSCDELKEWLKYNLDSRLAKTIYVEGCL